MADEPSLPDLGRFPKRALLTGAGFTKNWGGHLASEVWALLASTKCVRENPKLRALLGQTAGAFEEALEQVRSSGLLPEAVQRFEEEVVGVLRDQEHRINEVVGLRLPNWLEEMLSLFSRGPVTPPNLVPGCDSGYFFTLNQDLLIETITMNGHAFHQPTTPGVAARTTPNGLGREQWRPLSDPMHLEETRQIGTAVELAGNLNYIKLHGSYEWRTGDGRNALVVGGRKEETLRSFPVLSTYLELFRRICSEPDLRLMVIGYGFGDSHVNEIIATGVKENRLRIFLVDPTDPKQTLSKLRAASCPSGAEIADGIDGWSTQPLTETFRSGTAFGRSPEYRRILRDFFDLPLPPW